MDRLQAIFQAADDFKVKPIDETDTETQHPFQNSAGDVENLVAYVAQRVALNMDLGDNVELNDADVLQDHVNSWLSRNRGVRLLGLGGGKPKKTSVKSNNSRQEDLSEKNATPAAPRRSSTPRKTSRITPRKTSRSTPSV